MDDPNRPHELTDGSDSVDLAIDLVSELSAILEQSDIGEWPEGHREAFRKRLAQIIARVGPGE